MKSALNVCQQINRLKIGELKLSTEAKQWSVKNRLLTLSCWDCTLKCGWASVWTWISGRTDGWADHCVVKCKAHGSPVGEIVREIILDITGGYTDPEKWKKDFPGEHGSSHSVPMTGGGGPFD